MNYVGVGEGGSTVGFKFCDNNWIILFFLYFKAWHLRIYRPLKLWYGSSLTCSTLPRGQNKENINLSVEKSKRKVKLCKHSQDRRHNKLHYDYYIISQRKMCYIKDEKTKYLRVIFKKPGWNSMCSTETFTRLLILSCSCGIDVSGKSPSLNSFLKLL